MEDVRGLRHGGLTVTGFTLIEGGGQRPRFPPTFVMNDYIAGYMGAAGVARPRSAGARTRVAAIMSVCILRAVRHGSEASASSPTRISNAAGPRTGSSRPT